MENSLKKFKKLGTADLLKKVEKLTGVEKSACVQILSDRGQDVSKWMTTIEGKIELAKVGQPVPSVDEVADSSGEESPEPVSEESGVTVFEDETPLTKEEQELLDKAELKTMSMPEKVTAHMALFKKGSVGLAKIILITRARKITKLSDAELKLILAVPVDKVEKPSTTTSSVPKPPKDPKVEIEDSGEYFAAGTAVSVLKLDNTTAEGTIVSLNYNDKKVPYYKIKMEDKKVMCRVPKFVSLKK